jgi:hypothetical protein
MARKEKIGDIVWVTIGNDRQQGEIVSIENATEARVRLVTGPEKGRELDAPWGIIEMLKTRLEEQLDLYTRILQEIAGPTRDVVNKYGGHQLPYRWEIRELDPPKFLEAFAFTAEDILAMNGKSEKAQNEYLRTRFSTVLRP